MNESTPHSDAAPSDKSSRTRVHVVGALVAGLILVGALVSAPTCGRYMQSRQILSIQQAVRIDLMLILERESEFRSRHGFFTTDLHALEVAPKKVLYKFGFVKASEAKTSAGVSESLELEPSRKDLDALKAAVPELKIEYSALTKLAEIDFQSLEAFCPDCTATESTFKAIAAANLDDDESLDIWTIDEKGVVNHLADDLE